MKVQVLFLMPNGKYVSQDLSGLASYPHVGNKYTLNGQAIEVVEAIEPMVAGDGFAQMNELIAIDFPDATEAAQAVAGMTNLDTTGTPDLSGGGKSKLVLVTAPDKVVLVHTKAAKVGKNKGPRAISLGLGTAFTHNLDIKSLLEGTAPLNLSPRQPTSLKLGSKAKAKNRRRKSGK